MVDNGSGLSEQGEVQEGQEYVYQQICSECGKSHSDKGRLAVDVWEGRVGKRVTVDVRPIEVVS